MGLNSCSELKTDLPAASTADSKVHEEGWMVKSSPNFHALALKQTQYNLDNCVACHSKQFTGGASGVSCYSCHPGYPHPSGYRTATGHPVALYSQSYPLDQCKSCHGASYSGDGDAAMSCMKSGCHVDANNAPKSPEVCSTCHGSFRAPASDLLAAAPPKSVQGDTAQTYRGVGAHQKHLQADGIGKSVKCQECHIVPAQVFSPGHLGMATAEVAFNDTLARLRTAKGTYAPIPTYSSSTLKCSNTYCHGDWKLRRSTSASPYMFTDSVMAGENYAPSWTGGASNATCGSCHGLPPKGHVAVELSKCGSCHLGVATIDGKIADKTLHINGKVDVFGQQYAF
jgi:predicted CxxxxCH...CXXCH cytochrome family protein